MLLTLMILVNVVLAVKLSEHTKRLRNVEQHVKRLLAEVERLRVGTLARPAVEAATHAVTGAPAATPPADATVPATEASTTPLDARLDAPLDAPLDVPAIPAAPSTAAVPAALRPDHAAPPEPLAPQPVAAREEAAASTMPTGLREPPAATATPAADFSSWPLFTLLRQNLFAVAGVGLLLLGFAFLTRSVQWSELLPPWARLALAYLASAGLAVAGLRLAARRPLWAQLTQGGAAALAYLATYVASASYGLISESVAFALFAGISAALCRRALVESSKPLAALGFLGAYAAPVLALHEGGPLAFNLGYGLLVTGCALWISHRRGWLEIAIHAHVCAAGLAAITYRGAATPLVPWLQQALLHGYLLQLLAWTVAWSRDWMDGSPDDAAGAVAGDADASAPTRGLRARAQRLTSEAVVPACLALTSLCYLALQGWLLVPAKASAVAALYALGLTALGFFAFRPPRLREAAWTLAALSVVAAITQADFSTFVRGMGLLVEGVFLMLTVRERHGVRAWLGRLLLLAGAGDLLQLNEAWPSMLALLATTALALRQSPRDRDRDHSGGALAIVDGLLPAGLSLVAVLSWSWLMAARWAVPSADGLVDDQDTLGVLLGLLLVALQAGATVIARRGMPALAVYAGATALGWVALAALPERTWLGAQVALLLAVLLAGCAAARRGLGHAPPDPRLTLAAGLGSLLLLVMPAIVAAKLDASLAVFLSLGALAGVAWVALASRGVMGAVWGLADDTSLRHAAAPLAHALALLALVLLAALPTQTAGGGVALSGLAFLACLLSWVWRGQGVPPGVRQVVASALALVGLIAWSTALGGAPDEAWHATWSSHLLPVLLTAMGVVFLFHSSRRGERATWQAAAALCLLAMVKLLLSLGSALMSPIGTAASLLGMGALLLLAGYLAPLPPSERQDPSPRS